MLLKDLLAAHPEVMNEYKSAVLADAAKGQADTVKSEVAKALEADRAKAPPPATLAELRQIVPEKMDGRDSMILGLMEKGATVVQAHAAVNAKLAEQNQSLVAQAATRDTANRGLGSEGAGAPALRLSNDRGAGDGGEATYMGLVQAEMERLQTAFPDLSANEVRGRAYGKISRTRPDLLQKHNEQLAEEARQRSVNVRTKKSG